MNETTTYYVRHGEQEHPIEVQISNSGQNEYRVQIGETSMQISADDIKNGLWRVLYKEDDESNHPAITAAEVPLIPSGNAQQWLTQDNGHSIELEVLSPRQWRRAQMQAEMQASGPATVQSPMPGRVVNLLKNIGDTVTAGEGVIVVEAMKMENELQAPREGVIEHITVNAGDTVEAGQTLIQIGAPED